MFIFFVISIFMIDSSIQQEDRNLNGPTNDPSNMPSIEPTNDPSNMPSNNSTNGPPNEPTNNPSNEPTQSTSNSTIVNSKEVILIGFDNFKKIGEKFTFDTSLKRKDLNYDINSLSFPVLVYYKSRLRLLQEKDSVNCTCEQKEKNVECNCEGRCENKDISRIELIEDFKINNEENDIILTAISESQKNKIDKQTQNVYSLNDVREIMDNAYILDSSSTSFKLTGSFDNQEQFESSNLKLTAFKNNRTKEFICKGFVNSGNYTLNCINVSSVFSLDLNNTEAQIVEGDSKKQLTIQFPPETQSKITTSSNNYYTIPKNKKKGLSTGGMIAILIPTIIVLLGVLALAFMLNRKHTNPQSINNNTIGISSSTNINDKNII